MVIIKMKQYLGEALKTKSNKFKKKYLEETHKSPYSTKTIKKSFKGKRFWI